jgi:hypothetical protein
MACATCSHAATIGAAAPVNPFLTGGPGGGPVVMSKEELVAWSNAFHVPVDAAAYAKAPTNAERASAASASSSGLSNTAVLGIGAVLVAGIGTVAILATRGKRRRR